MRVWPLHFFSGSHVGSTVLVIGEWIWMMMTLFSCFPCFPAAVSGSSVAAMQLVQPGQTRSVCVCPRVCVALPVSKLCVNDRGERCLYTLSFQRLNQEEYLKNGKASMHSVLYMRIICLVIWKKKVVNIRFSFSFFFFAAIKKMIIFVSSFVFYIKTVYIYISVL